MIPLLLLAAEYLVVSVYFDAEGTPYGTLAALGVASACAALAFGAVDVRAVLRTRPPKRALAINLVAFPGLIWACLSGWFERDPVRELAAVLLVAAVALPVLSPLLSAVRWKRAAPAAIAGAIAFAVADSFDGVGRFLAGLTARGAAVLLDLGGYDVVLHAVDRVVGTTRFVVFIAPQCAGTEGLGLMVVFVGGALAWFRRELSWPRAFVLVPVALVTMLAANVLRIAILIAIGDAGAPDLALGGFHSRAGWVVFCLLATGLTIVVRRWGWLRCTPGSARDPVVGRYVAPMVAMLGVHLAGPLLGAAPDLTYGVAAALATIALFAAPPSLRFDRQVAVPLLVGFAVFVVWQVSAPAEEVVPFSRWLLHAIVSVLIVPVVEELAFRGYLMRRLAGRDFERIATFPTWTIVVSSAVFALGHSRWFVAFLAGLAYAWVYRRRGRLSDAVIAHAVTNALISL